ncbi:hypothetical protein TNCT_209231 [Trichonephila clavata]|uniref:Uncharacterized protein n=1 Tax=Trichonephila clavata TaxID=2740835 RepID=A0A8X6GNN8_TRICU|nr:hypothetical protein TNCT_209231 [Trichonephila clavata]
MNEYLWYLTTIQVKFFLIQSMDIYCGMGLAFPGLNRALRQIRMGGVKAFVGVLLESRNSYFSSFILEMGCRCADMDFVGSLVSHMA